MSHDLLKSAWQRAWNRTEQKMWVFGLLGRHNSDATVSFVVPGRAAFVFVTIRNSAGAQTVVPARNDAGIPHAADTAVRMYKDRDGNYVIESVYGGGGLATVPASPPSGVPLHIHDDRYFRENEHINISAGAADAGKPAVLDAGGQWDDSMIDVAGAIATTIHAATLDAAPQDADEVPGLDSSASFSLIRWTWTTLKAFLKTYFDTLYASISITQYTDEMTRDAIGTALVEGAGIDITVNDAGDTITVATTITQYTAEMAQDDVGGMFTGNVETDIAVTYQDATAKVDFVVSPTLVADRIVAAADKATPVDADSFGIVDSAASNALKELTWANIKATLKTYLDTLYLIVAGKAGGQTAYGGTGASENLTLESTSHATKGVVLVPTTLQVGDGTGTPTIRIDGAAATARSLTFKTAALNRFIYQVNAVAESGANAGSNWVLLARDDAGAALFSPIIVERATGYVLIGSPSSSLLPSAQLEIMQATLGDSLFLLQSEATGDNPRQAFAQGRVTTTNATPATLHTIAIPASHACVLEALVIARRTGGVSGTAEDCGAWFIRGLFNQVAGAAAIVGQTQQIIGESVAGYDAVFDVNSTNARIRVTGAATTNLTFHSHVRHAFLST